MENFREQIEDILMELEIDSWPGGGGWIDSDSKKKAVDELEALLKKEINTSYWQKRYYEAEDKVPYYEFVFGDKETGWVWSQGFGTYTNLSIGDTVVLYGMEDEKKEYILLTFNGVLNGKTISFNIEPKFKDESTSQQNHSENSY